MHGSRLRPDITVNVLIFRTPKRKEHPRFFSLLTSEQILQKGKPPFAYNWLI